MKKLIGIIAAGVVTAGAVTGTTLVVKNKKAEKMEIENVYTIKEEAKTEKLSIKMNEVVYNEDKTKFEVSFDITNNTDKDIVLEPDKNFKFYDKDKDQLPNQYQNDTDTIKKGQTLKYTLMYDTNDSEEYDIYFNSKLLKDEIKFTFKNTEMKEKEIKGFG